MPGKIFWMLWRKVLPMRNLHRLAQGMDFTQLVHSIQRQSDLWSDDQIWLRGGFPEPVWLPSIARLSVKALLFDLMRSVEGEALGGVVLLRLPPGSAKAQEPEPWYWTQYHMGLYVGKGLVLECGPERVMLGQGEVWYNDSGNVTKLVNNTSDDVLLLKIWVRHT